MKKTILTTLLLAIFCLSGFAQSMRMSEGTKKVANTMAIIENFYVDEVDDKKLSEDVIKATLDKLDPHSSYISAEDIKEMEEPLQGNFDGIGIMFNMMTDTLYVIETVSGGPSQKVGILPGDRIIMVNDTVIAGVKMSNKNIMSRLKGPKGTSVNVKVMRRGVPDLISFKIVRDKIPIYSLDAAYMVTSEVGYIRLSRFGATTTAEFMEACGKLKKEGMKNLILDLESNGGGYLTAAIEIANQFLDKKQLIVYTEGTKQSRQVAEANSRGALTDGKLVILINEASASASEIVSGAVQDWDRGVIVGRRSFGKGLVQRPFRLPDNSEIRLTVAKYYTPTGRSIQKPYENGKPESYARDVIDRYNKGEMMSADSIHFPDSLKYKTLVNERTVYGGGGIMPDYFVPIDTSRYSAYHNKLIYSGAIYKVSMDEVDKNRKHLLAKYPTVEDFDAKYVVSDEMFAKLDKEMKLEIKDTTSVASEQISSTGLQHNEAEKEKAEIKKKDEESDKEGLERSKTLIEAQLKSLIARDLYENAAYYKIMNKENNIYKKGIEIITDENLYNELLQKGRE